MKKILAILAGCLVPLICFGTVYAAQTDISQLSAFGIAWGTNINELSGFTFINDDGGDIKYYSRAGDDLFFGQVKLAIRSYSFYKDEFWGVVMGVSGRAGVHELYWMLTDMYGEPASSNDTFYLWLFDKIMIGYSTDVNIGVGNPRDHAALNYYYLPMYMEYSGME